MSGNRNPRGCQVVDCASDYELLQELLERTQARLDRSPYWTKDKDLEKLLYDAGKLIVIRQSHGIH